MKEEIKRVVSRSLVELGLEAAKMIGQKIVSAASELQLNGQKSSGMDMPKLLDRGSTGGSTLPERTRTNS